MPADLLLGGAEGGRGLLELRGGGLGGRPLGGQRLARLVELLGDDLELVAAGRHELGGLGGGGGRAGAACAGTVANSTPRIAAAARRARPRAAGRREDAGGADVEGGTP